jgi:hypothetical protein
MVEYGNGVSQGAGRVGGGGGGGGVADVGAQLGQTLGAAAHTITTLPPAGLLLLVVLVFLGLLVLRRAF